MHKIVLLFTLLTTFNIATVDAKDKNLNSALIEAVESGNLEEVKGLIKKGDDVNTGYYEGRTPLMIASWNGYTNIAKVLINAGADIDVEDFTGDTALMWATEFNQITIVKLLIANGADIDENTVNMASENGHTEIVEYLKSKGAK